MSSVTNPYFNHYHAANEQNLIQSMVDETIRAQGLEVLYIPRTQDNIDYVHKEDPTNYYNQFHKFAMYPINVDGFGGDDSMSFYAHEFPDTAEFVLSKKAFKEAFPTVTKPEAGALLFMTVTNALLEIKFCEEESPFFQKGKQYVFEIKAVAFNYSHEEMATNDQEINDILDSIKLPINSEEDVDEGTNVDFENDASDSIVYDPSNPFGVR